MDDKEFNEKYEQLKKSKFKQQKLFGWRPVPTISCVTIIYLSFALFFIIFGIIILVFTAQITEVKYRYDDKCNNTYNYNCTLTFSIKKKMTKPIMIYYQLEEFSQNHKVYMGSKSDKQLRGEEVSKEDLEKSGVCENMLLNKDIGNGLEDEEVAIPCGLMAKSYFRDKFFFTYRGKALNPRVENIAYKSDKQKYEKIEYLPEKHWINMTDEHFMIWMRPAPFPNPRKLWGIIEDQDIEKDSTISVRIQNNKYLRYKKYIILSTRNVFGGKSMFLGIAYIVFGVLCLIAAITFIITFSAFHKKK